MSVHGRTVFANVSFPLSLSLSLVLIIRLSTLFADVSSSVLILWQPKMCNINLQKPTEFYVHSIFQGLQMFVRSYLALFGLKELKKMREEERRRREINKERKNKFYVITNNEMKIDALFSSFSLPLSSFHSSPLLSFHFLRPKMGQMHQNLVIFWFYIIYLLL